MAIASSNKMKAMATASEPSLFDEPDIEWHEVPQDRFLSWSPAMQAAYCRDRDLDAAEHAENDGWREFYLNRAASYDRTPD